MRKGEIMSVNLLLESTSYKWANTIATGIEKLLIPLMIVACSVGLIYALVIGIKMMKAEDKNAREENKSRLINIAISIVAIAVLMGLFYALKSWLTSLGEDGKVGNDIFDTPTKIGAQLSNTFSLVKQCTRMLF